MKPDLLALNMREVLKTRQGQEIIWHILSLTGLYDDAFTGDNYTFYLEGKRAVGLGVLQLMEDTDPTAYARLQLAMQERGKNNG